MFDAEKFGEAMGELARTLIREAVTPLLKRIDELEAREPQRGADGAAGSNGKDGEPGKDGSPGKDGQKGDPGNDGKDGAPGKDGSPGKDGEKGADGVGLAGAMIDRDGTLVITKSNGEAVKLGIVVGKDGNDGKDGLSVESLEREYDPQTHEVVERWSFGGRTKEMRYPAGGIRAGGYWREGTKAVAGEAWTQGGSLWIAKNDTTDKPDIKSENWFLAARAGRDGERGMSGKDGSPPAPISLRARA